jgi:hypothetical protein
MLAERDGGVGRLGSRIEQGGGRMYGLAFNQTDIALGQELHQKSRSNVKNLNWAQ